MNQKAKLNVFIPFTITIVLITFFVIGFDFYIQKNRLLLNAQEKMDQYNSYIMEYTDSESAVLSGYINFLQGNDEILNAFLDKNKDDLLIFSESLLTQLYKSSNVTHFYFMDLNGKVMLRVHDPKRDGDTIERYTFLQAKKTKKPFHGLEFGVKKNYTLRVVHPWIVNGEHIGYIELGKEIDVIMEKLAHLLNLDILIGVNKDFYKDAPEYIVEKLKNMYETDHEYIVYKTMNVPENFSELPHLSSKNEWIELHDRTYVVSMSKLIDVSKKVLGEMHFFMDVSNEHNHLIQATIIYSVVVILAFLMMILISFFILSKKQKIIDSMMDQLEIKVQERTDKLEQTKLSLLEAQHLAKLGNWELDLVNNKLSWSDEIFEIFEIDQDKFEASYEGFLNAIHPDDREKVNEAYTQSLKDKESYRIEHRLLMRDGRIKYVEEICDSKFDANGVPISSHGVVIDNTTRVEAQQEIEKSQKFLTNIMESAIDGIVTINEFGIIQTYNKAAEELFGYTREEAIGQNVKILVPEPHYTNHDQYLKNYIETGIKKAIGQTAELHAKRKDGKLFMASIRIGEIIVGQERVFTALIQDISERKLQETQLIQAKEAAENAARVKAQFLANMSHEIRTPMNAIIGMSELALDTGLDERQKNYISKVHRSSELLLGIINDILDISKIEAGGLELEHASFNLDDMLKRLSDIIALKAKEKNIELMYWVDENVPTDLVGDSLRLNQIMLNLLSNALKYTNTNGKVILHVSVLEENEQNHILNFSIKDNGIGITQEQKEKLFKPFSQADVSNTRKYGGTGLGLAISKHLVELMDGEIDVKSEPNNGSEFYFSARFRKVEGTSLHSYNLESLFGSKRILIVEDSQSTRLIIKEMVHSFGFETQEVTDGQEGIALLEKEESFFDIVIVDWKMSHMDGVSFIEQMQSDESIKQKPKVIMVTAHGIEEAQEATTHIDVDFFVSKPLCFSTMQDALATVITGKGLETRSVVHDTDFEEACKSLEGSKILLVEDNEMNMELATDLLRKHGITTQWAENGEEALKILHEEEFDGVLMDCQMPVMDGYTASMHIREEERLQELPIIALTANALKDEYDKITAVGMNDIVTKPIRPQMLFITMAQWISPKQGQKFTKESDFETKQNKNDSTGILPDIKGLETAQGMISTNDSETLYLKLLKKFTTGQRNFPQEFFEAVQNDDQELAIRLAHTLKGTAATIGATSLATLAKELEFSSRDREEKEQLNEKLQKLQIELEYIISHLESFFENETQTQADKKTLNTNSAYKLIDLMLDKAKEYDVEVMEHLDELKMLDGIEAYVSNIANIEDALDNYDFDQTINLLEELRLRLLD